MKKNTFDFLLIFTLSMLFILVFYTVVENSFNVGSFGRGFVQVNVSIAIGLGALYISVATLTKKSDINSMIKPIIIVTRNIIMFMAVNLLLFISTFSGYYWLIYTFIIAALVIIIIFIFEARNILKKIEERIE